jgi:hypothetical protein
MANAYVVPFDFNPVSTYEFSALAYSYTVPAGKYAIVTYSLCASAVYYMSSVVGAANFSVSSGHNSHAAVIRLKAGDVLTRTLTLPSGSSAASGDTHAVRADLLLDGNSIARAEAWATYSQIGAANTFSKNGDATVHAHISEYNIAT